MKRLVSILMISLILLGWNHEVFAVDISAQSYVLMEECSGRVLLERNAHQKMPMASTTKIMTALVALEEGDLDEMVTIDEESAGVEGSSIYLTPGEEVHLKELVYGLMLRSGNDSAVAIANHISGSLEDFVDSMNHKAREIGAMNTNFMNPHGLHDDNHYSTAYDLGLITRAGFKNDIFREIFSSKTYKGMREKNNYYINKNKTLWEYDGGDGGKTGYTLRSGRCLVSSASRGNMRLISVSLNAPNWFNDNYSLMDYGFENYKLYRIYDKNQQLSTGLVEDGAKDKINLLAEGELYYPMTQEEKAGVKLKISLEKSLKAPIEKGDLVGHTEVYLKGKLIKKGNLIAGETIKKKSFIQRIMEEIKS